MVPSVPGGREGGGGRKREQKGKIPQQEFVLKMQGGGGVFAGHYGTTQLPFWKWGVSSKISTKARRTQTISYPAAQIQQDNGH